MKRLLVVDWDYFFPNVERPEDGQYMEFMLYDWGHQEGSNVMLNHIWISRAATFKRTGLPIPTTSGLETAFWSRFRFSNKAELFFAESNSRAASGEVERGIEAVWLFDAHHDAGYKGQVLDVLERGTVSCEDWMLAYRNNELHVRYPKWRHYASEVEPTPLINVDRQVDDEEPLPQLFHRVFVCRSGAWTPPWVDDKFIDFIAACPVQQRHNLDGIEAREFKWEWVDQDIEALNGLDNLRLAKE